MNQREPLLSDYALEQTDGLGDPLMGPWTVRDFYERLIDEGKLRVVEEVEAIEVSDEDNTTGGYFNEWVCSGCGRQLNAMDNFCPSCGNKIKR